MKMRLNIELIKKIIIILSFGFLAIQYQSCFPYATENEIKSLETFKREIYLLEAEVKELKIRQLNLIKERAEIIKKLNKCQKFRDSLINSGVQNK